MRKTTQETNEILQIIEKEKYTNGKISNPEINILFIRYQYSNFKKLVFKKLIFKDKNIVNMLLNFHNYLLISKIKKVGITYLSFSYVGKQDEFGQNR